MKRKVMRIMMLLKIWILLELLNTLHVKMVLMLSLRHRLNQILQTMQPTEKKEGQMLYLRMQSFNVKTVREHLVVHQVYGSTQSQNMKVSSMHVSSVTKNLHIKVN